MDGERYEFDQVGIGSRVRIRRRQGLTFLQETLGQILHRASNHQPGVGQVETLRDSSGEIQGFRNHHLAGRAWEVEGNVVAEHRPIILHRAGFPPYPSFFLVNGLANAAGGLCAVVADALR